MTSTDLTEKLLDIKREKGWSWRIFAKMIGGFSPVLIVGAILGQMKLTKPQAKAEKLFGLSKSEVAMLNEIPMRGTHLPPTDPLIYRFYELIMVNGPALKALIEEEFGDGMMSAIDFDMNIERQADPKGDRVSLAFTGLTLCATHVMTEPKLSEVRGGRVRPVRRRWRSLTSACRIASNV